MTDDTVAACRAALVKVAGVNLIYAQGRPPWCFTHDLMRVEDAAAALARAIAALTSGHDAGDGPCPVCTDRALAAVRQDAP